MPNYSKSLAPIAIAGFTLRNRYVMGSMHTGLEEGQGDLTRLAAFYKERAEGEVGLIVTGGFSPDEAGRLYEGGAAILTEADAKQHIPITQAVHEAGGRIVLQLLHAGRYAKHARLVAPSAIAAPINKLVPKEMSHEDILQTITSFAQASKLAQQAGYDGIEIMGSEGYLINTFTCLRTNKRNDEWGGSLENRLRLGNEIIKAVRAACGNNFIIMFRVSALDLVEEGLSADEVATQARALQAAGADVLDTGIGWHEARIPTIGYMVPRAAWLDATRRIKAAVTIPVMATNRINTAELAEEIIASGTADLISMARPWLADSAIAKKARENKADEINTCIACNQACLDFIFRGKTASCVVNPRACRETELPITFTARKKRVAVVGAGAAGMSCATTLAERGHAVTVFEREAEIGGQMNFAKKVPGKEFAETIRHYVARAKSLGIEIKVSTTATAEMLNSFDDVVIATGVEPRIPDLQGFASTSRHAKVLLYTDVLAGRVQVGQKVIVIGGGGIGVDTALFLVEKSTGDLKHFMAGWGADPSNATAGGIGRPKPDFSGKQITIFQRGNAAAGRHAGPTVGWAVKAIMMMAQIRIEPNVEYLRVDDQGLHYRRDGMEHIAQCDNVIICAGQVENTTLYQSLVAAGKTPVLIGGAKQAAGLDALRAIEEGMQAALAMA